MSPQRQTAGQEYVDDRLRSRLRVGQIPSARARDSQARQVIHAQAEQADRSGLKRDTARDHRVLPIRFELAATVTAHRNP